MKHGNQTWEAAAIDAYLKCAARLHKAALVFDAGSERAQQREKPDSASIAFAGACAQAAHMIADLFYLASASVARGQRDATTTLIGAIRIAVTDAEERVQQTATVLESKKASHAVILKEMRSALRKAQTLVNP